MAAAISSIPNFGKSLLAVLVILTLMLILFINTDEIIHKLFENDEILISNDEKLFENYEILISNDKILEKRVDSLEANMMHNMDNLFGNDVILIGNDKIMAKKINEKAQETSGPMRTADTDSNEDVLG